MGRNNTERSHLYMYVRSKLSQHADKVFAALMPGGCVHAGLYLCGSIHGGRGHSCVTDLESGIGYDITTQTCWGDYIDLGRYLWNCLAEESALRIMDMFGLDIETFEQELASKKKHKLRSKIPEKELIYPPPLVSPPLPKRLGDYLEIWPYFSSNGHLLYYVAYFPAYMGKVKRLFVSLFRKINGRLQWFAGNQQPAHQLYNLPKIQAESSKCIMIVRRESYVHLVEDLFPNVVGTTWPPGLRKLDVLPLRNRLVSIWPEASIHGCAAAQILSKKLTDIGVGHTILNTLEVLPEGWNLGSPLPTGSTYKEISASLTNYIPKKFLELADYCYPTLQHRIKSLGYRDVEYL